MAEASTSSHLDLSHASDLKSESAQLEPAQPVYVLRGHAAPVHALLFLHSNLYLVSGDADGWLVVWNITTRRPSAVWHAHKNAILGMAPWGRDKLITHGRDNRLYVWALELSKQASLSTSLPVEDDTVHRPQPWLLHALHVNTANFCPFSVTKDYSNPSESRREPESVLVTVPNALDSGGIDIFRLPSETRIYSIPPESSIETGMSMTVRILHYGSRLVIAAGYESGHAMLFHHDRTAGRWQRVYAAQPHSQPVLSLDVAPSLDVFFTSSADAIIAKHPLDPSPFRDEAASTPLKVMQTKHAGQQGLQVRADGKLFATAGWDARVRVYASRSMRELAVLKWHKDGCYATAFADVDGAQEDSTASAAGKSTALIEGGGESKGAVALAGHTQHELRGTEQRRSERARATHWLAAGSKDGKVSLWDIY